MGNLIAEALGIPAGPSGLHSDDPYPLEVPIRVRGLVAGGNLGADSICEPFLEDTLTVLVSPRGAVLRLAAHATPGQMITLSSPRLGREMPARVIRYRGHADVKGYAEIEFAPEAAIPGVTAPASAPATAPRGPDSLHSQNCSSTMAGAPLVVMPLADLLGETESLRGTRSLQPSVPPAAPVKPQPAPARAASAESKPPQTQPARQPKAPAAPDLETLLAARKAAEQAVTESLPPAPELAQRLLEPAFATAFAAPHRPRKRWLAAAAAALLTLGAVAAYAVVAPVPAWESLPEIAAFALPEPPEHFAARNEVRVLAREKFETATLPIATQLISPARAAVRLSPLAPVVRQRQAAENADAPQIRATEVVPTGVAKPGLLGALGTLAPADAPAPPVGGELVPPRLLAPAPVEYPQMARMTRAEGSVVIDALIDENGRVAEMRIVSGPGVFHQAAKESLAQWRYQPALLNGKPISTHLYVTIQFKR
jgi:TonB family protein